MFRFIVKFLKILVIACLIGVSLRIIETMILKENIKNINEVEKVQYEKSL